MQTNIFYQYEDKEYTIQTREQLEEILGSTYLEYAEERAEEEFESCGFGSYDILLPNDSCVTISYEEVDEDEEF